MSDYVRYGEQWRNEVMKNKKSILVDMLRRVAMERDNLETAAQQSAKPTPRRWRARVRNIVRDTKR